MDKRISVPCLIFQQGNLNKHKKEGNINANKALTMALGLRGKERSNWTCCHIRGVDDAKYGSTNLIVQDARFFSCVGNMLLLPTPLKTFTDVMPEVKRMIRACAANLYGWACDHEALVPLDMESIVSHEAYPASWPRTPGAGLPLGTVAISDRIRVAADRRLAAISNDMASAGPHYPRDQVRKAMAYWNIAI